MDVSSKMYSKAFFLVFSTVLFSVHVTAHFFSTEKWVIDSSSPRQSPISFSSNTVTRVNLPPLRLAHWESDNLVVNNTGYKLQLSLDQEQPYSIITGGTLFNEKYTFSRIEFIWNGYWGASCSHTIDGRGAPLEMEVIYINVKYKTFEDALLHSDGMAIISVPIVVEGHIDNPLFEPLKEIIQRLINPTDKPIRTTGAGSLLESFFNYKDISTYYSYPGAYVDYRTNKFSYCSTVIIVPDYIRPLISIDQFQKSFLLLQTGNGSPLTRPLTTFDAGSRPVWEAYGTSTP